MRRWSPERWAAIKALFSDITELPREARAKALDERTGEDRDLRDAVRELLQHAEHSAHRLDRGAAAFVPSVSAPPSHGAVPAIGSRLGVWELVRVVGAGGMGVVFEGMRREGDGMPRAAVKVLPPTRDDDIFMKRFATEQRLLQSLDHPGIARFVAGGDSNGGRPWYAMEFIDGPPIDTYCRAGGIGPGERARLVRDVCMAVQHAHDHQVLHRDLKPSNILVTREGKPVVVDFGIARSLDDTSPGTLTRAGFRPVSLVFASPEHLAGGPLTPASDVYSLGAVLYLLLSGTVPDATERPPSRSPDPSMPWSDDLADRVAAFDACVKTALHRDALHRYPTARVFAAALDRAMAAD